MALGFAGILLLLVAQLLGVLAIAYLFAENQTLRRRVFLLDDGAGDEPPQFPRPPTPRLLGDDERDFYRTLREVLPPHCVVLAKVHLDGAVRRREGPRRGARGTPEGMTVDFLVVDDETTTILVAIELDLGQPGRAGPPHPRARNDIIPGLALLRLPATARFDRAMLRTKVIQSFPKNPQGEARSNKSGPFEQTRAIR